MKKNVASQKIGAQMVSASDGSAFTGTVTVSVTGDAGTQATGTVGSGICTHEGNGYHTYAPSQSETNFDLIAFTFTGTGAIPTTVQVFTDFPQTGDAFAQLPAALVGGRIDASVGAVNADATAAANLAKTTRAIGRGTVTTGASTTSIPTSAFTPAGAAADQFKGRIITFDADTATTALRGQSTDITASTNAATPTFTVSALSTAPASGDTFSVT